MINVVVQILTRSFIFRGRTRPRGRQRSVGGRRTEGRKGEGIELWVYFAGSMTQQLPKKLCKDISRLQYWSYVLLYWVSSQNSLSSVCYRENTCSGEFALVKKTCPALCIAQFTSALSSSVWAGEKGMPRNDVFVCHPLSSRETKDYQGRGVIRENQGPVEQMCVVNHLLLIVALVLSSFLTKSG